MAACSPGHQDLRAVVPIAVLLALVRFPLTWPGLLAAVGLGAITFAASAVLLDVGGVRTRARRPLGLVFADTAHWTGITTGAPLSLTKKARNLAGFVLLALRPTRWTSSGPS